MGLAGKKTIVHVVIVMSENNASSLNAQSFVPIELHVRMQENLKTTAYTVKALKGGGLWTDSLSSRAVFMYKVKFILEMVKKTF